MSNRVSPEKILEMREARAYHITTMLCGDMALLSDEQLRHIMDVCEIEIVNRMAAVAGHTDPNEWIDEVFQGTTG